MTKPVKSIRLDPELLDKAQKAGIDLAPFVEAALAKALNEKKCPYCGQVKRKVRK